VIQRSIPTIGKWPNRPDPRDGLQPRMIRVGSRRFPCKSVRGTHLVYPSHAASRLLAFVGSGSGTVLHRWADFRRRQRLLSRTTT
jgi:hypothetical protein